MNTFLQLLMDYKLVIVGIFVNFAISIWFHRKVRVTSVEEYVITMRTLPTAVFMMLLLGAFLDIELLRIVGDAFSYGILNILYLFAVVISFLLIGTFLSPHIAFFNESITLGDLMKIFYGHLAQFITGVISALTALLVFVIQILAIGILSFYLLKADPSLSILCFGSLVVVYSVWGGIRVVSYTDILQIVAVLVVFSWVAKTVVEKIGGIYELVDELPKYDIGKAVIGGHPQLFAKLKSICFWIFSGTFMLSSPIVQRMLIIQDRSQVRRMWYGSAAFYALVCGMALLVGFGVIIGQGQLQDMHLYRSNETLLLCVINTFFGQQSWAIDFIFLGLLTLFVSTIDSYLQSAGISLVQDIIGPIRVWRGLRPLSSHKKVIYAKIGIAIIGFIGVMVAYIEGRGSMLFLPSWRQYIVLLSGVIIFPITLGIMGVKTDRLSWIHFSITYVLTILGLTLAGWSFYDYFFVALCLAILAYLATHIVQNGGIVILQRGKETMAEQLWFPSWISMKGFLKRCLAKPFELSTLARKQVLKYPTHPLNFSLIVFALFTFTSITSCDGDHGLDTATFMIIIQGIGIVLCCILMLEDLWPARIKPYFPLYWFFTLFYCLPFSSTLKILKMHEGPCPVFHWFVSYILLALLVGSTAFLIIAMLGTSGAFLLWYMHMHTLPATLWNHTLLAGIGSLIIVVIGILLFTRKKEGRAQQHLYLNQVASGSLAHEIRHSLYMLGGVGHALSNAFKEGKKMEDSASQQGFWIPIRRYLFLDKFSGEMIREAQEGRKDLDRFTKFIEQQVFGVFEQHEVSMNELVKEGVEKISKQYEGKIEVVTICEKDFKANLLATVFPNVILNLVKNAYRHGHASKVTIKINGEERRIHVKDNGEGIPKRILPHIFELFFTSGQGTGVGLAFLKMVIEASGGKVACFSKYGGLHSFTEFIIELP